MKIVLAVLAVLALANAKRSIEDDLSGSQVLRTYPNTDTQLMYLQGLQKSGHYDFWTEPRQVGGKVDIMSSRWNLSLLKSILKREKIEFNVMIADVDTLVKEQEATRVRGPMDWHDYHEYDEIITWMENLASSHSDLVSIKSVGQSYEGRTMKMATVSTGGSGKPGIFIDGGIHAREWISPSVVTYILNELVMNSEKYRAALDMVDVHFIPSINPDGYAYTFSNSRLWRKTRKPNPGTSCYGTDPNRNWDHHWMDVGASDNPCSDIYAGSMPFSEIEMRNVRDQLSAMSSSLKSYLTFHSYSQLWMYPWGYTSALPDDWRELDSLAQDSVDALYSYYGTYYEVGSSTNTIYAAAGGSDDWAKAEAGIKYSYTIELRDTGNYGFLLPTSQIQPTCIETFAGFEVTLNFIADTYGKKN